MKSLQESLFDSDLASKGLTLSDVSCILAGNRGMRASGEPIGLMFNVDKLEKYANPYYADFISKGMSHFLGIVMDQPVPKRTTKSTDDWGKNLKKELRGYIKRQWISEFDQNLNIEFYFDIPNKDYYTILFDLDGGMGEWEFVFKWNK